MSAIGVLGTIIFLLGPLVSFVVFCVLFILKNKNWKKALLCVLLSLVLGFILIVSDPELKSSSEIETKPVTNQEVVDDVVEFEPDETTVDTKVSAEDVEPQIEYDFPSGMEQFNNNNYPYVSPEDLGKYFSNMNGVTIYTVVEIKEMNEPNVQVSLVEGYMMSTFDVGGKFETYDKMLNEGDTIAIIATVDDYDNYGFIGTSAKFKDCTIFAKDDEANAFKKEKSDEVLKQYFVLTDIVAETANIELTEEEFKGLCNYLKYNDILRNPDSYKNKYCIVSGRVSQVIEGFLGNSIFINDSNGNQWGCTYSYDDGESHILEGDYITVYGKCNGTTKAKTLLGKQVVMPYVYVEYVE